MKWETWILFVITEAVLSMTPGPAVLFVLSHAVRQGPARSLWAACGILSANALYFALSATSLGAIFAASQGLFFVVKWAGSAYLFYLGAQSILSRSPVVELPTGSAAPKGGWKTLRDGMLLQGANPKAVLFFAAILPQFVDTRHSVPLQILILGLSSIIVEFIILFIYGQLAGRMLTAARHSGFETWTNRAAGILLILAAAGLARIGHS